MRTLRRLGTSYLDVLFLHDVEFVATQVPPQNASLTAIQHGNTRVISDLSPNNAGQIWGDGDAAILEAYGELRKLKSEGLVRSVGITGQLIDLERVS